MLHVNVVLIGQSLAWWDKTNCTWGFNKGKQKRAVSISCTEIGGGLFYELCVSIFELLPSYASLWQKTCAQVVKPQKHVSCSFLCMQQNINKTLCYMPFLQEHCPPDSFPGCFSEEFLFYYFSTVGLFQRIA